MLALMLCLLAADAEPAAPVKVLAKGEWRHGGVNGKKALVILKAEDLANLLPYSNLDAPPAAVGRMAAADLAADMGVKSIDWSKQMAVILLTGEAGSGGYTVEVTKLKAEKGTLTVSWKRTAPAGAADSVITHPSLAVLLPRFTGKVVFDPPLGK